MRQMEKELEKEKKAIKKKFEAEKQKSCNKQRWMRKRRKNLWTNSILEKKLSRKKSRRSKSS